MRFAVTLLSCTALLTLAACGSGVTEHAIEDAIERDSGEQADVDIDNGMMRIATEDGTVEIGEGAAIPADWPADVAVYQGATVQYSATGVTGDDGSGMTMGYAVAASAEDVVAYYKKQMADQGWAVQATINVPGGTMISASKDERTLAVQVSGDGTTTNVVLVVGNQ